MLFNIGTYKPKKKLSYQLDLECDEYIIEIKTQTFFTSGTAAEKILGVPIKYSDVPRVFKKPLKIILVANTEVLVKNNYKILCCDISNEKKKIIDFYKTLEIEFICLTDFIKSKL